MCGKKLDLLSVVIVLWVKNVFVHTCTVGKTQTSLSFSLTLRLFIYNIFLQSDDAWSNHISVIYEKASKRLNIVRLSSMQLIEKHLLKYIWLLYDLYILEYDDVVWDN